MNASTQPLRLSQRIIGLVYLPFQLFALPQLLRLIPVLLPQPLDGASLNFLYFAVNFTVTTCLFFPEIKDALAGFIKAPICVVKTAGEGYLLYCLASYILGLFISLVSENFQNINDAQVLETVRQNMVLMGIGSVVLVPVAEELLYRVLIFGLLKNRTAAYVISTIVFAAVHLLSYLFTADALTLALCFLQYIPAGLCLAWAYERTGCLLAPILIHSAVNLTSLILTR